MEGRTMTRTDIYDLLESDESLQLMKTVAEKGWNLVCLLKSQDSEGCVLPGIVKAHLYKGDASGPFFFWTSSESDVVTVLAEVSNYLELPDSDDPGIQRAERIHQYHRANEETTIRALTEIGMVKEGGIWVRRHG